MNKLSQVEKDVIATLSGAKGKQSQRLLRRLAMTMIERSISAIVIFAFIAINISCPIWDSHNQHERDALGQSLSRELAPQSRLSRAAFQGTVSSYIEKTPEDNRLDGVSRQARLESLRKKVLVRTRYGSKNNTGPSARTVEMKVGRVLDRFAFIYGPDLFSGIRGICVVPHLKGGALSHLRHGVIRLDARVVEPKSDALLSDQIEHELWHAVLADVDDNAGIQEIAAIFQSLRRFADSNYDVEDWMQAAGRNSNVRVAADKKRYQRQLLGALDPERGIDPQGKARSLYEETDGEEREFVILGKVAEYIFYKEGHEKEKAALRQLKERREHIVYRAMKAIDALEKRRRDFIIKSYVLLEDLHWDFILEVANMARSPHGRWLAENGFCARVHRIARAHGVASLTPEAEEELICTKIGQILETEDALLTAFERGLTAGVGVPDTPSEIHLMMRNLALRHGMDDRTFRRHKEGFLFQLLERRVLSQDLPWEDVLRTAGLMRTHTGRQDAGEEVRLLIHETAETLGISELPQEKERELTGIRMQQIINMEEGLINELEAQLIVLKEQPDGEKEPVFITDKDEIERRIRGVMDINRIDEKLFNRYRDMILLQLLRPLFETAVGVRNISRVDKAWLSFEAADSTRQAGQPRIYRAVISVDEKPALRNVELPVFLNGLWALLNGYALEIRPGATADELWLYLEDVIECARLNPVGAYLTLGDVHDEGSEWEDVLLKLASQSNLRVMP